MYNDTITVANKIISDTDLFEIFQKMNDELKKNISIYNQEKINNEKFEREYQHWTTKDFDGTFKCTFNFYDDTNISVDNYNSFITIFNSRLHEIKDMWVRYHYNYTIQNGNDSKYISKLINLTIYEHKIDIEVKLGSEDDKMNDIYELIKEKIQKSPVKYDRIIKSRTLITNKIGFATGFIPGAIICTLLLLSESIRHIFSNTYIIFPLVVVFLSLIIGGTITGNRLSKLYSPLVPEKKYAGYDSNKGKSIYKDDIDSFIEKSEIIIGKNIDNLKNRKEIEELEKKWNKYIPIELISLLVLTIVVIIIGKIF